MSNLVVLLDACVLYPAPLRDLLMRLTVAGLFTAHWTEELHQEWIAAVLRVRPDLTLDQLYRTRDLMNQHADDCLVAGYESLIPSLTLPDPDDRHVLAAAIHTGAAIILTFNLRDFPASELNRYGVRAVHPDPFIDLLIETDLPAVCSLVRHQRQGLRRPARTAEELLATFVEIGLPRTAERLRRVIDQI